MQWTDERIAILTDMLAAGASASQIAAVLGGVTRNAVIGKAHRLGLSGPPRTKQQALANNRLKMRAKRKLGPRPMPIACRPKVEKIATLIVSNAVSAPLSKALLIDALTAGTCKWMDGHPKQGGTYCGHDTLPGEPYCGYHYSRAHYKGSQADFDRIADKVIGKEPKDRLLAQEAA